MARPKILTLVIFLLSWCMLQNAIAQDPGHKKKKETRKEKHLKKIQLRRTHEQDKEKRKEARKKEKLVHKKQKKELRKLKKKGKKHHAGAEVVAQPKVSYPATRMKTRYRVDVLAQLYLDEAKNYKIPDKAQPGIGFYEGVNIAADSLKKIGYNIDIYVHDISSMAESAEMLVAGQVLDSSDLIIGAVQSPDIPALAAYAAKKHVNFISAMSPADAGIKDNPYFTLLQPSLRSHCEWIATDVAKKFPGMKVGLLYRTSSPYDSSAHSYILGSDASDEVTFKKLNCNTLPTRERLQGIIDTSRPNVLVVSILDFAFADSLLNEISRFFPSAHFEVYGMPSWNSMANLRKEEAFPNLSVNVTVPFNFDTTSRTVKYVSQVFRRDYGNKTTDYVYRGYEAMYWYANLLRKYGTIFNEKYNDNTAAPFTRFNVIARRDRNGDLLYNENTHIFVSKFEGGASRTE